MKFLAKIYQDLQAIVDNLTSEYPDILTTLGAFLGDTVVIRLTNASAKAEIALVYSKEHKTLEVTREFYLEAVKGDIADILAFTAKCHMLIAAAFNAQAQVNAALTPEYLEAFKAYHTNLAKIESLTVDFVYKWLETRQDDLSKSGYVTIKAALMKCVKNHLEGKSTRRIEVMITALDYLVSSGIVQPRATSTLFLIFTPEFAAELNAAAAAAQIETND